MPKNEDGEFELVLANRQLLSVFFIVVILLGVFFTMGYIVGRNSAPLVADVAGQKTDSKPVVADAPARPAEALPAETPPTQTAPAETAPQQPVATAPQRAEPEPAIPEPVKPKPAKLAKPAASNHPVTGQAYLQLAATSQHEAEILVDVLRKKGFKAMASEIDEKPGTFRVLVGPVTDNSSINKARADLQSSGFPGNAAIRRTF